MRELSRDDVSNEAPDPGPMRAVILAGGLGTRLRPYTTIIPKPLVPVGDRPILLHIIGQLAAAGVRDIDLCVNYLGELIQVYLSQVTLPPGVRVHWHWEAEAMGTAGALRSVADLNTTFIAMNGDVLTGVDFRELWHAHRTSGAALTIATHAKTVSLDLGVIETVRGRVTAYREKPTLSYDVSMGIYVYEPYVLDYLPEGQCQLPDLVDVLLRSGEKVGAYRTDAPWYDIGTPQEYERAVADIALLGPLAEPLNAWRSAVPEARTVNLGVVGHVGSAAVT